MVSLLYTNSLKTRQKERVTITVTHQPKMPQTKVENNVIDPNQPDQGEKLF